MPLPSYLKVHPGAAVSPSGLAVLRTYLTTPVPPPAAQVAASNASTAAAAADLEFTDWIKPKTSPLTVQPEFNGVPFTDDYKNWRPISSTDRFDNHTMREILGNDIALQAIAENHINPWPDGAAFAKVAWAQAAPDADGIVKTGKSSRSSS